VTHGFVNPGKLKRLQSGGRWPDTRTQETISVKCHCALCDSVRVSGIERGLAARGGSGDEYVVVESIADLVPELLDFLAVVVAVLGGLRLAECAEILFLAHSFHDIPISRGVLGLAL